MHSFHKNVFRSPCDEVLCSFVLIDWEFTKDMLDTLFNFTFSTESLLGDEMFVCKSGMVDPVFTNHLLPSAFRDVCMWWILFLLFLFLLFTIHSWMKDSILFQIRLSSAWLSQFSPTISRISFSYLLCGLPLFLLVSRRLHCNVLSVHLLLSYLTMWQAHLHFLTAISSIASLILVLFLVSFFFIFSLNDMSCTSCSNALCATISLFKYLIRRVEVSIPYVAYRSRKLHVLDY